MKCSSSAPALPRLPHGPDSDCQPPPSQASSEEKPVVLQGRIRVKAREGPRTQHVRRHPSRGCGSSRLELLCPCVWHPARLSCLMLIPHLQLGKCVSRAVTPTFRVTPARRVSSQGRTRNASGSVLGPIPGHTLPLHTHRAPLRKGPAFPSSLPKSCKLSTKERACSLPSVSPPYEPSSPLLRTAPHTSDLLPARSRVSNCARVSGPRSRPSGEHQGTRTPPGPLLAFSTRLLRT